MIEWRVTTPLLTSLLVLLAGCDPTPAGSPLRLEVTAAQRATGETTRVELRVLRDDGLRVTELDPLHGQPMHLIATSFDLEDFHHVHPTPRGDGSLVADLDLRDTSSWALFAEVATAGDARGEQVLRHTLWPGRARGSARLDAAAAFDGTAPRRSPAAGLTVSLAGLGAPLRAGAPIALRIAVEDLSGAPVLLEDWMGMPVHAIAVSEDLQHFLHFHGARAGTAGPPGAHGAHGAHGQHHHPGAPTPTADADGLTVPATFPAPGLYKLWVQVRRSGEVITAPFVARVSRGADRGE